jgi:hypothetical protein
MKKGKSVGLGCETNTKLYPMSIETLTESILSKMSSIGKWQKAFFVQLMLTWLSLRGRYTFENLSRQVF